jgi:hypothetical protein
VAVAGEIGDARSLPTYRRGAASGTSNFSDKIALKALPRGLPEPGELRVLL